jgi:hypothetical protein
VEEPTRVTDTVEPEAARTRDALADICGEIAAAFRRTWGRGPVRTSARWAGPDMLVVLLENGHNDAEKSLRAAGLIQQILEGRQLLQTLVGDELVEIVERNTGRRVITTLSSTRLDPDLSAEMFLLGDEVPPAIMDRAETASQRARDLGEMARAVTAQSRLASRKARATRSSR